MCEKSMNLVPRNIEPHIHEFSIEVNELLGKFVSRILRNTSGH